MQNILDQNRIKRLYELGHFFNPDCKDCWNVKPEDLVKLTLKDKVVKDAIASFKDMMWYDFSYLSKLDKHTPECNGDCCETTIKLFDVPRCGHPDYDNPALLGKVGSGSFPEPCQKAGIKVHINKSRMPAVLVPKWPDIQKQVFAAYHQIGANLIEVENAADAHITVWWEVLFGSTIGMAQFNSESCSGKVWCKLDPGYTGLMFELFAHELGHNNNLNHTRGGIMNPSVIEVNPKAWNKSDPSYNTLVRYYGGEPITPDNPLPTPLELPYTKIDFNSHTRFKNAELDFPNKELRIEEITGKKHKFVLLNNAII
jgi:hypothetical protein